MILINSLHNYCTNGDAITRILRVVPYAGRVHEHSYITKAVSGVACFSHRNERQLKRSITEVCLAEGIPINNLRYFLDHQS